MGLTATLTSTLTATVPRNFPAGLLPFIHSPYAVNTAAIQSPPIINSKTKQSHVQTTNP